MTKPQCSKTKTENVELAHTVLTDEWCHFIRL